MQRSCVIWSHHCWGVVHNGGLSGKLEPYRTGHLQNLSIGVICLSLNRARTWKHCARCVHGHSSLKKSRRSSGCYGRSWISLHRSVQHAKYELSVKKEAIFSFSVPGIHVSQRVARAEFEELDFRRDSGHHFVPESHAERLRCKALLGRPGVPYRR